MCGLPPQKAIRIITLSPKASIAEIKMLIKREYKLNPIIDIHLILNGKVLPDIIQIEKAGINSRKDLITVIPNLIGGAVAPFKQFNFKCIRSCIIVLNNFINKSIRNKSFYSKKLK